MCNELSRKVVLGVVGGVGGTLTLLSYNYWMREKGWRGAEWAPAMRFDLRVGYLLTGLFGVAAIVLGATVLQPRGITISGSDGVREMATVLSERFGRPGEIVFLVGFYGAVATSLLGVWQGVPYLFGNYIGLLRGAQGEAMERCVSMRGRLYRGFVLFMTFPPMLLLLLDQPVWLVVGYAAVGALFITLPLATQELLLRDALIGAKHRREKDTLEDAWRRGDLEALARQIFASPRGKSDVAFFEAIYFARNREFAEDIARLIDAGGRWFVALGAGHMVGDEGIPQLLAARGYRVERVPKTVTTARAGARSEPTTPQEPTP